MAWMIKHLVLTWELELYLGHTVIQLRQQGTRKQIDQKECVHLWTQMTDQLVSYIEILKLTVVFDSVLEQIIINPFCSSTGK